MNIESVARQLLDGMLHEHNLEFVCKRLEQIAKEDKLSLKQLDDLCWEDSTVIFDRIYEEGRV